MYKFGFTGSREGMTPPQWLSFANYLQSAYDSLIKSGRVEFHHGDCAGADAQAHAHVATVYGLVTDIHIHPPTNSSMRAFCDLIERPQGLRGMTLVVHPPKDYLERNHDIVDETDMLIATPKEEQPAYRSGTWATIRYSEKQNKPRLTIYPSGRPLFWTP